MKENTDASGSMIYSLGLEPNYSYNSYYVFTGTCKIGTNTISIHEIGESSQPPPVPPGTIIPTSAEFFLDHMALDSEENVYCCGFYESNSDVVLYNRDGSEALSIEATNMGTCGYVYKMNPIGEVVAFSKFENDNFVECTSIIIDSDDNIYTSIIYNSGLTIPIGTLTLSSDASGITIPNGAKGTAIVKWTSDGDVAAFTYFECDPLPTSLSVDSNDNVYFAGVYKKSTSINIKTISQTPSASDMFLPSTGVRYDAFVIKWNANGNVDRYSYVASTASEKSMVVKVDSQGNVYLAGSYQNSSTVSIKTFSTFPTSSGYILPIASDLSGFIIKWNSSGTVTGFTYVLSSKITDITLDTNDNVYAGGLPSVTSSIQFKTLSTTPIDSYLIPETYCGFIIKWSPQGSVLAYTSSDMQPRGLHIDSEESLYMIGNFYGGIYTFDTNPQISTLSYSTPESDEICIIKWLANGTPSYYNYIDIGQFETGDFYPPQSILTTSDLSLYAGLSIGDVGSDELTIYNQFFNNDSQTIQFQITNDNPSHYVVKWNYDGSVSLGDTTVQSDVVKPGGSLYNIQYRNGGSFAGSSSFKYYANTTSTNLEFVSSSGVEKGITTAEDTLNFYIRTCDAENQKNAGSITIRSGQRINEDNSDRNIEFVSENSINIITSDGIGTGSVPGNIIITSCNVVQDNSGQPEVNFTTLSAEVPTNININGDITITTGDSESPIKFIQGGLLFTKTSSTMSLAGGSPSVIFNFNQGFLTVTDVNIATNSYKTFILNNNKMANDDNLILPLIGIQTHTGSGIPQVSGTYGQGTAYVIKITNLSSVDTLIGDILLGFMFN